MKPKINLKKVAETGDPEKIKDALCKVIYLTLEQREKVSESTPYINLEETIFSLDKDLKKSCNTYQKLLESLKPHCKNEEGKNRLELLSKFFDECKSDIFLQILFHQQELWDGKPNLKRLQKIVDYYYDPENFEKR